MSGANHQTTRAAEAQSILMLPAVVAGLVAIVGVIGAALTKLDSFWGALGLFGCFIGIVFAGIACLVRNALKRKEP